ncbi:MAG TPA: CocE/NonD family hydrolase [Acidobacteriaceae bacterium]|nr:CocE/NonD family hydrolase [Acidobacteriaceae bacterium]
MGLVDCGSGVRLERGVTCRMSDGAVLVSDHYYPEGEGPFPTLLMRQPYGRDIASTVVYAHPVWFARHGYQVVIQDVRGRGDSEGVFYPFRHERKDGAETIAWLRSHPRCNGSIGMYGFSYQGMTQLLAAVEQPQGLVCIAPAMTACDLYHGWFYRHGALRLASSLGWGLQMLRADVRRMGMHEASATLEAAWSNLRTQANYAPYGRHPALQDKGLPVYVKDWFRHAEPSSYWEDMDISRALGRIAVPALHLSGWFDTYLDGSVDGFLELQRSAATRFAREHQYLLAGPWIHIPWGNLIGVQNFGSEALLDTDEILLRWFNHWMKDTGEFCNEPRIRHFALGENRWFASEAWPRQAGLRLFLHSGGRANSRKGDGVLAEVEPADDEPRDIFVYDPEVPVFAPGGPSSLSGPHEQAEMEQGNNLLVYTSEPLQERQHIFGHPAITLYAATSAESADFTAKLVRVRPDGSALFLCMGIARSSWLFAAEGYSSDTVQRWHFDLDPISCVFFPGERIRLEIASSAFPLYDRNPSTNLPASEACPGAQGGGWSRSTQQVLHTAEHRSVLLLPLAESAA